MNLIKVKFLKNEVPTGRDYTYKSDVSVAVGDIVMIDEKKKGVVTDVDVPESEIEAFKDKVKTLAGLENKNEYGEVDTVKILDGFIGTIFSKVENVDNQELIFTSGKGAKYIFYHEQDCCEDVIIEDICGELSDLENSPILMAEEIRHKSIEAEYGDSQTYTFYKFATIKGYVTVRWCGSSNGYYSESVDFRIWKVSTDETEPM